MTEELKVEPDQLDTFANKLKQLATDHTQATPYVQQWLKVDDGAGGVFLTGVVDTLGQILTDLESNFATLTSVTEGAAAELLESAQMYRSTDHATAAALDKTYVGRSK
ncbi:type VII secretion target [Nocardia salmonicida]|uniref:type VII secretion target n=1 Tax=Nocardia salmonicida TaxID=53431 RepID=UPI003CFB9622